MGELLASVARTADTLRRHISSRFLYSYVRTSYIFLHTCLQTVEAELNRLFSWLTHVFANFTIG